MVKDGRPANVSARSDAGSMDELVARRARCAAPTVTGDDPNAFDSLTRARRPPMLVRRIMRMVWFESVVTRNGCPPGPPPGACAVAATGGAACDGGAPAGGGTAGT